MFGRRRPSAPPPAMNPGMQRQPAGAGLSALPPAELQRLQQMQGMLQGAPIGNRAQVAQPQATQMPTAQTGATQVTRPSVAQQMGGMGLAGTSLQQQLAGAPMGAQASTPPSVAQQMGGMGLAGTSLQQQLGNKPAGMKKGGAVKKKASGKTYKSGGSVSSASKRADGCAIKGKTRGKIV